jgi:hypothetical protein
VSETSSKPVEVGVVLPGGGALGVYECGAVLELIDDLASKIALTIGWLNARLDEARRYNVIDAIVNIDMQDPAATLIPTVDKNGMRDFWPEDGRRRRRDGFRFAHDILWPAFENRWRALDAQPREAATAPGS